LLLLLVFRTFAAVKGKNAKVISSWVLLCVYVPMLILSSIHTHRVVGGNFGEESVVCSQCVNHEPHAGHLTTYAGKFHDCVLCQFLQVSYLRADVVALAVCLAIPVLQHTFVNSGIIYRPCNALRLRAPPAI